MYSVGLFTSVIPRGTSVSVRTPDGDLVRGDDFRFSMYDVFSRWLALVGKAPPRRRRELGECGLYSG